MGSRGVPKLGFFGLDPPTKFAKTPPLGEGADKK
jgi:hypothetical protein